MPMSNSESRKRVAELAAGSGDETGEACDRCGRHRPRGCLCHIPVQPPAPDPDETCSCGNSFDGDNLCMKSACQWEGIDRPTPAPPATTGPADEAEGLAEFRLPPSRRGRFENVRKAGIQHYNERPDDSTTPAGGGVPSSASRAVEHQAATVSPAGPNLAELIHRAISPTGMDRCHQDGDGYAKCVHVADTVLASDWLAARDAAQQRIGAEKAWDEGREAGLSDYAYRRPSTPNPYRADRIAREGDA